MPHYRIAAAAGADYVCSLATDTCVLLTEPLALLQVRSPKTRDTSSDSIQSCRMDSYEILSRIGACYRGDMYRFLLRWCQ